MAAKPSGEQREMWGELPCGYSVATDQVTHAKQYSSGCMLETGIVEHKNLLKSPTGVPELSNIVKTLE